MAGENREASTNIPVAAYSSVPVHFGNVSPDKASRLNTSHLRKWLRISTTGQLAYVTADKHTLVTELGVPSRDLRILDPLIASAYPTAILIREKAMVVHLESIRMIICKDQVLLISVPMPLQPNQSIFPAPDSPFVQDLVSRFTKHVSHNQEEPNATLHTEELPYELLALEAALATGCKALDLETSELENKVVPALERLAQQVNKQDLEEVRHMKSNLNRLLIRVGKVKQVIEGILDDDNDMQDMYLGRRAELEAALALQQSDELSEQDLNAQATDLGEPSTTKPVQISRVRKQLQGQHSLQEVASECIFSLETDSEKGLSKIAGAPSTEGGPGIAPASRLDTLKEDAAVRLPQADSFTRLLDVGQANLETNGLLGPEGILRRASEGGASLQERQASAKDRQLERSLSRSSTQLFRTRVFMQGTPYSHRVTAPEFARGSQVTAADPNTEEMQTIVWTRDLSKVDPREIESCEDLLDSYFLMADSTLSRLDVLREKIEATEALISINLDSRRNDLVAFDLLMTMATTCMAFSSMTASIFGQNLFFNASNLSPVVFLAATLPALGVSIGAMITLLILAKRRQLLFR